jgi:hypothetical protein
LGDNPLEDGATAPVGHMHIEQDHVRNSFNNHLDGRFDLVGFTDQVNLVSQFRSNAGANECVIIY